MRQSNVIKQLESKRKIFLIRINVYKTLELSDVRHSNVDHAFVNQGDTLWSGLQFLVHFSAMTHIFIATDMDQKLDYMDQ